MKFIVNADDYGRTKGITDNTIDCIINGKLNSVSIPSVGEGFEYSIDLLKTSNLSNIRKTLHIDLVEGPSILSKDKIDIILDAKGRFKYSFASLWFKYLVSDKKIKGKLREQIKNEIIAQIEKYIAYHNKIGLPLSKLNIDSHQHIHMVPFVFDIIIELSNKYKFDYIRLPNERFFICIDGVSSVMSNLGPNLIKHFILKVLSRKFLAKYQKEFIKNNIAHNDYFIGVLFTGYMTLKSVKMALLRFKNQSIAQSDLTIEFLFHPCKAKSGEESIWKNLPGLKRYYFSKFRDQEIVLLKNEKLECLLKKYESN